MRETLVAAAAPGHRPLSRAALGRLRRDRLARLIPLDPAVSADADIAEAAAIVLALTRALASEEWRGAAGDWSFRPARLEGLRHALARARADLRRRRRAAARNAQT
jgi:hypothetical protein